MEATTKESVITAKDAAKRLGVVVGSIYVMVKQGRLQPYRSMPYLFLSKEVDRYLEIRNGRTCRRVKRLAAAKKNKEKKSVVSEGRISAFGVCRKGRNGK